MSNEYDEQSDRIAAIINSVDSKPHAKFIKYLFSKKYSPSAIRKELQKLALSSPHEKQLGMYYLAVIDPIVRECKMGAFYGGYKNRLLKKSQAGDYSKDLLNFRLDLGESIEDQIKFCKFITAIDVEESWSGEIMGFYGTASNVPEDENGERIIKTTAYKKIDDKILRSEHRYLIDKMILEGVPDTRIATYMKTKFKLPIHRYDVTYYKRVFFSIRTHTLEDKITQIKSEKNSLEGYIDIINSDAELSLGDKIVLKKQTEDRIKELTENIRSMNMLYSEAALSKMESDNYDFEAIFVDVALRAYTRLRDLDIYKDRDVVDPLVKVSKMIGYAHDKAQELRATSKVGSGDKHAQAQIVSLYRQRVDEVYKEQQDKHNVEGTDDVKKSDILGIDEINVLVDEYEGLFDEGEEKQ